MRQLPLLCSGTASSGQVRTNAARTQHMGEIHAPLPGQRGRSKPFHVRLDIAYLLSVAVSATFSSVDLPTADLRRTQRQILRRAKDRRLPRKNLAG